MYAIIQSGGKQYRIQPGDTIRVEKLENKLGDEVSLTEVLALGGDSFQAGKPTVSGATVTAVVTQQEKGRKVIVFKKKRRQGYRRFGTHRQNYTELFIKAISFNGKTAKADKNAVVVDMRKLREERKAAKQAQSKEN